MTQEQLREELHGFGVTYPVHSKEERQQALDAIILKVQEYVAENQSNSLDTILVDGHNIHYKDKNYRVASVEINDSNPVDTLEPNSELSENES